MLRTLNEKQIKYFGQLDIVRKDPEGAFGDQGLRRGLAAESARLDMDLGESAWKTWNHWQDPNTMKQPTLRVAQ